MCIKLLLLLLLLRGAKKCVHPLHGGDPSDGKKACLYATCTAQKRLSYRWFRAKKPTPKNGAGTRMTSHPLSKEMTHVKVNLVNDEVMPTYIDYYALTVIPRPLPSRDVIAPPISSSKPNVVVILFEEASVQNFRRKMPMTEATMTTMGFVTYKKHSAVATSARDDVTNLILGHVTDNEKSDTAASTTAATDNSVFKIAKANGYTTLFSAEDPTTASGFGAGIADTSLDHNALPFFSVVRKQHQLGCGGSNCYCMTGNPIFNISLNYLRTFLHTYPGQPKLAITLMSEVNFYTCSTSWEKLSA